jgi:ribosome-associated translation inhibitor RaiA
MDIIVTGRRMATTEALKEYAEEKVAAAMKYLTSRRCQPRLFFMLRRILRIPIRL